MENDPYTYRKALEDFHKARSKAAFQRFWANIRGESLELLPYDEISSKLRAVNQTNRGLQQVPLKQIVGSVNRTEDFDRNFLPLRDSDSSRWAQVKTAMTSPYAQGLPPVQLYKLGDAYFVLDGNHRVSIAREMHLEDIEAYVTEVHTRVPVPSDMTAEEVLLKSAYVSFLEDSHIDQILPGIDFSLNSPENYPLLLEHIAVHRYYMSQEQSREIPYEEAIRHWYETVYTPVIRELISSGLAHEFHELSLTDLYLWILDRQSALNHELGLQVKPENATAWVANEVGTLSNSNALPGQELVDQVLASTENPDERKALNDTPNWYPDCLFRDIWVALSDSDPQMIALQQAILLNRCPQGGLLGLHISPENAEETNSATLEETFNQSLQKAGMQGSFHIVKGEVSSSLQKYSLLGDLLVLKLNYPPGGVLERLSSGIVSLLRESRRPTLLVKETVAQPDVFLLLYDGSPKSKEALYAAAYFVARYQSHLCILSPEGTPSTPSSLAEEAHQYMQAIGLPFKAFSAPESDLIDEALRLVETEEIHILIAGGYEGSSWLNRLFSQPVDRIIEQIKIPLLIYP